MGLDVSSVRIVTISAVLGDMEHRQGADVVADWIRGMPGGFLAVDAYIDRPGVRGASLRLKLSGEGDALLEQYDLGVHADLRRAIARAEKAEARVMELERELARLKKKT